MTQKNMSIVQSADMTHLWDTDKIKQYMFAGHAVFAIDGIIYKIAYNDKGSWSPVYTIDKDTPTWIHIGWVTRDLGFCRINGPTDEERDKIYKFYYFLKWLAYGTRIDDKNPVFQISRFCARCGMPLKSAKSLTRGYGAECMKEVSK